MQLNLRTFRNTHGRDPRGFGNWAFATTARPNPADVVFLTGQWGAVRKQAAKRFAGQTVHLLP